MAIDWNSFTPWSGLAGGFLIGLAAALFVLLNGRIAGISGILGGLLRPVRRDVGWRLAFVAGMLLAPAVYALFAVLRRLSWPPREGLRSMTPVRRLEVIADAETAETKAALSA